MTAFPISPRFSPDIIAHLISVVKPSHILVNTERLPLIDQIIALSKYRPEVLQMPEYSTIFSEESYSIPETHSRPMDTTALIIHSSGIYGVSNKNSLVNNRCYQVQLLYIPKPLNGHQIFT